MRGHTHLNAQSKTITARSNTGTGGREVCVVRCAPDIHLTPFKPEVLGKVCVSLEGVGVGVTRHAYHRKQILGAKDLSNVVAFVALLEQASLLVQSFQSVDRPAIELNSNPQLSVLLTELPSGLSLPRQSRLAHSGPQSKLCVQSSRMNDQFHGL